MSDHNSLQDFVSLLDGAGFAVANAAAPELLAAASNFWRAPLASPHLTSRMKELVLLALHAASTTLNPDATERHVVRALAAGATASDIVDVLVSIVGQANHALYAALPILDEEMPCDPIDGTATADPEVEQAKASFVAVRGFLNSDRETIARSMPAYYVALTRLSVEPWKTGTLTPRERELVYIAIDCSVTHSYPPGLRLHIRNAAAQGATRDEILEVFQLAALMGLEGVLLGIRVLGELDHQEPQ